MNIKKYSQDGFHVIEIALVLLVLGAVGFAGYRVMQKNNDNNKTTDNSSTPSQTDVAANWSTATSPTWVADGHGGWIYTPYETTPPACPDPIQLESPTPQISQATSILYPGQTRTGSFSGLGGNYKPHGAFRFDKSTNDEISVVMPFNGYVLRGSQFKENGELQYDFDIVNACGVMIRVGHLRTLSPAFKAIADKFPAATEGDSRTTSVSPVVAFKTGDVIATSVGFKNVTPANVSFDFGVYDLRNNNEASKSEAYKSDHSGTGELAFHALCWLNLLNSKYQTTINALPAGDSTSGDQSDYCEG